MSFRPLAPVLGALVAVLALAMLAVAPGSAQARDRTRPMDASVPLADYATPLVGAPDANGVRHIDTPATIAKLSAAHINTYAYLVYGRSTLYGTGTEAQISQAQWDDLPGFASAAAEAGINVLVYLVPPTESTQTAYEPYGWNYDAWADAIANLAVSHPNIREMVMDDFATNTVEGGSQLGFAFTPAYVQQMMSSARSIAPSLKFRAIMYYPNVVGTASVMAAFRPVLDGVIFPYRATSPGGGFNTTDASAATQQGGVVSALTKCQGGQHCAQLEFPKNTPSTAGDYAALSQTVRVTGGATKTLSFWEDDDFGGTTSGYHYLQALVDGTVVWQSDVAASSNGLWQHVSVDVSAALAGKTSATLTLRLWDAHAVSNFHVTGFFDDVSGSGFTVADGGFENASFAPWASTVTTTKFTNTVVATMSDYFMTYTSRFSNETAPTTTTYVQSVLSQALDLVTAGKYDGSITYTLNLTGQADGRSDPAIYGVVRQLYGGFQPSRRGVVVPVRSRPLRLSVTQLRGATERARRGGVR